VIRLAAHDLHDMLHDMDDVVRRIAEALVEGPVVA